MSKKITVTIIIMSIAIALLLMASLNSVFTKMGERFSNSGSLWDQATHKPTVEELRQQAEDQYREEILKGVK